MFKLHDNMHDFVNLKSSEIYSHCASNDVTQKINQLDERKQRNKMDESVMS